MSSPVSLWAALKRLRDNPILWREWRGLAHQSRDWRLWVGLRVPKDARGWGVPAVAWFLPAPYFTWWAVRFTAWISPTAFPFPPPSGTIVIDILALVMAMCAVYVCLIAVGVMAPTISRERERLTWDILRSATASPHDIALGLLVGRLAPVIVAWLAAGAFWVLARPHYAGLLVRTSQFRFDRAEVALLVLLSGVLGCAVGTLALAASAWCGRTALAILLSVVALVLLFALIGGAFWLLPAASAPGILIGTAIIATIAAYALSVAGLKRTRA